MLTGENVVELVAFELLDEIYAIDIKYVEEIQRSQEITDVPHTPEHILGVINLRGQIIPVIDLKIKFGMEKSEVTNMTRIIVVNVEGIVVGLQVDSVSEVLRLTTDKIEPPSPVISTIDSEQIQGVGKDEGKMIIILDVEKILIKKSASEALMLQSSSSNLIEG